MVLDHLVKNRGLRLPPTVARHRGIACTAHDVPETAAWESPHRLRRQQKLRWRAGSSPHGDPGPVDGNSPRSSIDPGRASTRRAAAVPRLRPTVPGHHAHLLRGPRPVPGVPHGGGEPMSPNHAAGVPANPQAPPQPCGVAGPVSARNRARPAPRSPRRSAWLDAPRTSEPSRRSASVRARPGGRSLARRARWRPDTARRR